MQYSVGLPVGKFVPSLTTESVELITSTTVYGFLILHRNLLSKSLRVTAEK